MLRTVPKKIFLINFFFEIALLNSQTIKIDKVGNMNTRCIIWERIIPESPSANKIQPYLDFSWDMWIPKNIIGKKGKTKATPIDAPTKIARKW